MGQALRKRTPRSALWKCSSTLDTGGGNSVPWALLSWMSLEKALGIFFHCTCSHLEVFPSMSLWDSQSEQTVRYAMGKIKGLISDSLGYWSLTKLCCSALSTARRGEFICFLLYSVQFCWPMLCLKGQCSWWSFSWRSLVACCYWSWLTWAAAPSEVVSF